MAKAQITFKKLKDGSISLNRTKNYEHMLAMCYAFHRKYMEVMAKHEEVEVTENEDFTEMIERLAAKEKTVTVSEDDIRKLRSWIDSICQLLIEEKELDFNHKNIAKFFALAQDFLQKTKEYGTNV